MRRKHRRKDDTDGYGSYSMSGDYFILMEKA